MRIHFCRTNTSKQEKAALNLLAARRSFDTSTALGVLAHRAGSAAIPHTTLFLAGSCARLTLSQRL
jgi:hypothetical protein